MRLLGNLIIALTLVWPVPLAMPAAPAAPAETSASHAMHEDAAHHADHRAAPSPAPHDSGHMPDCCVGAACFSLALTEAAGVPFEPPRGQLLAGDAVHLAAISHPPDLPPPRP